MMAPISWEETERFMDMGAVTVGFTKKATPRETGCTLARLDVSTNQRLAARSAHEIRFGTRLALYPPEQCEDGSDKQEAVKGSAAMAHCFHRLTHKGDSMRRQIVSFVGVFGLLLVAACANAQSLYVKANVPFNFVVDKDTLPAGNYSIRSINNESGGRTLVIQSGTKALKLTTPDIADKLEAAQKTHLLFHRYGDEYFLAQIWVQGEKVGRHFRMSRREAEIAKNHQTSD